MQWKLVKHCIIKTNCSIQKKLYNLGTVITSCKSSIPQPFHLLYISHHSCPCIGKTFFHIMNHTDNIHCSQQKHMVIWTMIVPLISPQRKELLINWIVKTIKKNTGDQQKNMSKVTLKCEDELVEIYQWHCDNIKLLKCMKHKYLKGCLDKITLWMWGFTEGTYWLTFLTIIEFKRKALYLFWSPRLNASLVQLKIIAILHGNKDKCALWREKELFQAVFWKNCV